LFTLTKTLFKPVAIDTLVFLRIALGLLGGGDILGNGVYFHWYLDDFSGFTFRYYGFEWVHPLPEPLFSLFFVGGFLLGIAVALGWRFKVTAPLFALAFTYLFLLEKAHYLNHAYLFTWLAWLLVLTPAWREFSLDVRRRPTEWAPVAPAWSVYLFPLLMGIVYFFGGIAKMNYDWLIRAMPLHMWLENRASMPILGPVWEKEITAYVMAWGGMLLDFTVPFLLLHRRLKWVALGLLFFFHVTNHLIFNIGIFPYLSLVLTSMFFAPDWPKRFVRWVASFRAGTLVQRWLLNWRGIVGTAPNESASEVSPFPGRGAGAAAQLRSPVSTVTGNAPLGSVKASSRAALIPASYWQFSQPGAKPVLLVLTGLIVVHCLLPLRHWSFDSDVNWSEEGHRYSWRMMLRSKQGHGTYTLIDKVTGESEVVYPADSLTTRQYRKMVTHPDMILQYAHHLRDARAASGQNVEIYGRFRVRLNGRKRQDFIAREVDLAVTEWVWLSKKDWVLTEEVEVE
jgi:hypothetical protein